MAAADAEETGSKFIEEWGPQEGTTYPIDIMYCGVCRYAPEYCEYSADPEKCKAWLESHLPDMFDDLHAGEDEEGEEGGDGKKSKRQKRGGKANKVQKKAMTTEKKICLSTSTRGKRKSLTVITGLATYGINPKEASKIFSQKFACGTSVTGPDEIVIQGDCKDDLFDLLTEKWPEIDEDTIDDLGEVKR